MHRLIGIVPLGIGLSVLGFAWSDGFGGGFDVPIFFRIFPSFIALAFIFAGAKLLTSGGPFDHLKDLADRAIELEKHVRESRRAAGLDDGQQGASSMAPMTSEGYVCPSCNAPIGSKADVSPHGDVKCAHCGRWFNVHG